MKRKTNKAFTLVELLVVIAIIGILSAISAYGYQEIRKSLLLDRVSAKLSQDIKKAEEMAMGGKIHICQSGQKATYVLCSLLLQPL